MGMFCNQCEQTIGGTGCTAMGVCGKHQDVAGLQDLMIHQLKGIGYLAHKARLSGKIDDEVNRYTAEALFSTTTNVDFDPDRLMYWIGKGESIRQKLLAMVPVKERGNAPESVLFAAGKTASDCLSQTPELTILNFHPDPDIRSLEHLLLYGLKGLAAYADHAAILGKKDDAVFGYMHKALSRLNEPAQTVEDLVPLVLECGTVNIRCMQLLDEGHTSRFGHPGPVNVSTALKKGPAIVISGHDLADLEELLRQTEGKGVNVYTHGEMLPAHGYPGLRKYDHLAGHFGTAWQNQQKEFDNVPAAFVFTTNCIQKPRDSYKDRVFTCGLVGWPGVAHIESRDFSSVISKAKQLGGFAETAGGVMPTGFARNAILSHTAAIVEAVKNGTIKRFLVIGGCDGAKPGRNYYTEFALSVPKDCVIITHACGKFRFNACGDFGSIGGIPRFLDVGQCNDIYSAVVVAQALAQALRCTMNDVPMSFISSWYEQKAVVVLLSLLSLGIKGIRYGPSMPAFMSKNVLSFFVRTFDIKPITSPAEDLKAIFSPG
jgi:hydroxylamine reductase